MPHSLRLISISASSDSSGGLDASGTSGSGTSCSDHGYNCGMGAQGKIPNIWGVILFQNLEIALCFGMSFRGTGSLEELFSCHVLKVRRSTVFQYLQFLLYLPDQRITVLVSLQSATFKYLVLPKKKHPKKIESFSGEPSSTTDQVLDLLPQQSLFLHVNLRHVVFLCWIWRIWGLGHGPWLRYTYHKLYVILDIRY